MWTLVCLKLTRLQIMALILLICLGANPSETDGEDALEDGSEQVNDVAHSFRLQATTFDKKSYLTYLKVRLTPCILIPLYLL